MTRPLHEHEGLSVLDEFLAGFTVETLLSDADAAAAAVSDAHAAIADTDWADPADALRTQSYLARLQSSLPSSHQLGMCQITNLGQPVLAVAAPDGTWTICVPGVGATVSVDLAGAAVAAWELLEHTSSLGRPRHPTDPATSDDDDDEKDTMLEHAANADTDRADQVTSEDGISGVDGTSPGQQPPSDNAQRIAEVLAYLDREAPRWPRTSAVGEICQAVGTRLLGRKHHWHPGDR